MDHTKRDGILILYFEHVQYTQTLTPISDQERISFNNIKLTSDEINEKIKIRGLSVNPLTNSPN